MSYTTYHTLLPSAARTTSGESGVIDLGFADEAIVFLDVTAVSGTAPTLDVKIQVADPNGAYYDLASFTQVTAVGRQARQISNFGQKAKIVYTIGGTTPSFTFSVTAISKTIGR